jgi:predicted nucleic-acid-binding protein
VGLDTNLLVRLLVNDDAAQAARALGLPLREVTRRAEQAWRDGQSAK